MLIDQQLENNTLINTFYILSSVQTGSFTKSLKKKTKTSFITYLKILFISYGIMKNKQQHTQLIPELV